MRILALKYGESTFGENYIFKGGSKDKRLPISFTTYLIQTEGRNILVDAGCDDGAGFEMSVFQKPVDILKDYGLSPNDITDVVITHSHHDHVAAIGYYENSIIHVQKDEYEAAKRYIPIDFNVHLFDEEYSLTEHVKIRKIGGHTLGSCIVLADNYVLCGDECYYEKCLTDKIRTGSSHNQDKSQKFIEEFSKDKYIPLLFHDPSVMTGRTGYVIVK